MNIVLTPSDVIEIISIIASLITSIVAIVISMKSLRQNSKMIEETTRPNIQIYPLYINTIMYLIVKNFGSSEAYIDEIKCSHKFTSRETMGDNLGEDIFSRTHGAILSPGYALRCPLIGYEVADEVFDFYIKYHSSSKSYENTFSFNPVVNAPFADLYPSKGKTTDDNLNTIARELHDIVKTTL